MEFSDIEDIDGDRIGEQVRIRGWLYTRTEDDDQVDLTVRDPTGMILCRFYRNSAGKEDFLRASRSSENSAVTVYGVVRKDTDTQKGYRLQAKDIQVLDEAEPAMEADDATGFQQDLHDIWAYPNKYRAVNTVADRVYHHADTFMQEHDYSFVQFPGTVTENRGGPLFIKDGETASPHLFLEALLPAVGNTYTVTHDDGHSIAAQRLWANIDDIIDHTTDLVAATVRHSLRDTDEELEQLGAEPDVVREQVAETTTVTHTSFANQENELMASKEYTNMIVVTGAEESIDNVHIDHADQISSADVYAPGYGRVARCFELESDPAAIAERVKNSGENPDDYEWLFDLRRNGVVQHAGLSLELGTIVQWLTGLHHEAETRNFPHLQR